MTRRIVSFIVIVGLFSCTNGEGESPSLLEFNINPDKAKNQKFTDLFLDFEELMIPSTVKIANINKLIIENEILILFDGLQQQIVVLNHQGGLLSKIQRTGKGPGEYTRISDVSYNPANKLITALDYASHSILLYNLNGDFDKSIRLEFTAYAVETNELGNHYLYTPGRTQRLRLKEDYNMVILDSDGGILEVLFPFDKALDHIMINNPLTKSNNEIYFNYGRHDTLFGIVKNQAYPIFSVDKMGALPYRELYNNQGVETVNQHSITKHGFAGLKVLISDEIINFNYVNKGFIYKYYYNRKSQNYLNIKALVDDYYKSDVYFPIGLDSDVFYFIIHPISIKNKEILNKHHIDEDQIDKQNPFIVKCRMQKF
jgi:hypothetical protein